MIASEVYQTSVFLFITGIVTIFGSFGLLAHMVNKENVNVKLLIVPICIMIFGFGILMWSFDIANKYNTELQANLKEKVNQQMKYLDSSNCDQVRLWLSDVNHNKTQSSYDVIQHARDILISECLK